MHVCMCGLAEGADCSGACRCCSRNSSSRHFAPLLAQKQKVGKRYLFNSKTI